MSNRKTLNEQRLKKLHPKMAAKVAAVLKDLEGHGFEPVIDSGVHRTPAEQAALKKAGRSTVSYSYHNVTSASGKPESLAADITDIRWGWNPPANSGFWLYLAASAEAHGLASGIYWGLPESRRVAITLAIKTRSFKSAIKIGWDPAHIEWKGLTLAQAKAGVRP